MEKVKSIRRKQEALQQSLSGSTAGLYEGRAQNLRLDFIEAVEQEKILEKYLQFEQSHTHFFEPLVELVQAAKRAVDVLRNQVHFNEETGTYTVAKTFAPAMKSLQDSLQNARGIDPKLDEQLENYEILAVVYKDNTGKDAVMWVLEKDGIRVQNAKLQKYIEQTGRYQDAEKYTIITLADLDKKITKAWQKGTYYMNGKVYSGGTGKVLQASAYVQEWKGKLDESGLTDVVLGLGLSTAAIRGSMEFRGDSRTSKHFVPKKVTLENGEIAYKAKGDVLVRSPKYLDESGNIKWPEADGFVVDTAGKPITVNANLKAGQIIDRYGDPFGKFTSPVENGKILAYDTRGLPYPESAKVYRQYKVVKDINIENVQKAYDNLSPVEQNKLTNEMIRYKFSLEDIANPKSGKIAKVFGAGGGTQVQMGTVVAWYEKMNLLKEIK
nr:TNT domain-containing protein [Listeria fleischmannii]